MIADHEANVVYVADTLERKFPDVHVGLRTILERHGIPLRIITGTKDIWCRDYMPVQVAEDRFIQFRYAPDYLTGKYRHLRADGEIGPTLPFLRKCERSQIVLDGGNIVRWKDVVIMTEKIYRENPRLGRRELEEELRRVLDVERLIVIPSEPGDVTGHADGVLRFVARGNVVVNDYRTTNRHYRNVLMRRLRDAGLKATEIPFSPESGSSEGMPSAAGNYVNFLRVGSIVVVPNYLVPMDEEAERRLMLVCTPSEVIGLDSRDLASAGGVLNCVTWPVILSADRADIAGTCT